MHICFRRARPTSPILVAVLLHQPGAQERCYDQQHRKSCTAHPARKHSWPRSVSNNWSFSAGQAGKGLYRFPGSRPRACGPAGAETSWNGSSPAFNEFAKRKLLPMPCIFRVSVTIHTNQQATRRRKVSAVRHPASGPRPQVSAWYGRHVTSCDHGVTKRSRPP